MKVIWSPEAELDRLTIFQFIAAEDHSAAIRMDELFSQAAQRLGKLPRIGRPGLI
ncbi:type II toxin-antitoxin system RelE/ParE family toxin [Rhizobium binxianense]